MVKKAAIPVSIRTMEGRHGRLIPIPVRTTALCFVAMAEMTKGKVKAA